MKKLSTSLFVAAALMTAPASRLLAKDHEDHHDHEHHTSTAEKVIAGIAIAGLAAAAAHAASQDRGYVAPYAPAPRPVSMTIYVDGRPTPIFLRPSGTGYCGPRGEYYPTLPGEVTLYQTYGRPGYRPPARAQEWERGGSTDRDSLKADVIQGGVRIMRGGRVVCTIRTAMPVVEKWKFDNDNRDIIVKSRGNHGPAMVQKFSTKDGALEDKVMAFDIRRSNVRWARGFED